VRAWDELSYQRLCRDVREIWVVESTAHFYSGIQHAGSLSLTKLKDMPVIELGASLVQIAAFARLDRARVPIPPERFDRVEAMAMRRVLRYLKRVPGGRAYIPGVEATIARKGRRGRSGSSE
jgi:hypothetical protein